ncbi:MAG: peptidoglycan DD-metalloendopeptidase family protein [Candidatus Taylorbacteria bacterium]|nr:peptidoglycan DD-metalloendopeptidase family protein [Candidatus Taylorbacteria bacterium]
MRLKLIIVSLLFAQIFLLLPVNVSAETPAETTDIQSKIDSRTADIQNLEKLIQQYQNELTALGTRESSLAKTLSELNLTQKKLQANISLTQDKIDAKNTEIRLLSSKIKTAQGSIAENKLTVSESMKRMNELGDHSLPSLILSSDSLSDSWNTINTLAILSGNVQSHIVDLQKVKKGLETNKLATERAKAELISLESQLSNEKKVVIETTNEQKRLLTQTKNSEAAYERLLIEKKTLKDEFERELLTFESQLNLEVDISKLPGTGRSILSWPLDNISITQYFGNTSFAIANSQLYNGNGHNGVDFRATIGTPVKASLSGIVVGTGNTDIIPRCYSLGKWILVRHTNGLSTLYAHLSLQTTAAGNQVSTGQTIGYSGNTGYTTGPHLHFGVYASSGIEIKRFTNSRSCGGAILPVAVLRAYLNPLSYLPTVSN